MATYYRKSKLFKAIIDITYITTFPLLITINLIRSFKVSYNRLKEIIKENHEENWY